MDNPEDYDARATIMWASSISHNGHLMWLNGIDHSFAQPDLLAVLEKINEKYPNLNVRQSTCEDYMRGVVDDLAERGIEMERV